MSDSPVTVEQQAEACRALSTALFEEITKALAGPVSPSDVVASLELVKFTVISKAIGILDE